MPDGIIIEDYPEAARASVVNNVKAAFQKSKGTGQPFCTSGLKNIAEQAYESEDGDVKPVVRNTRTKTSFGDIMAQARADVGTVKQEKKKKGAEADRKQHERPNARADTPKVEVRAGRLGLAELGRTQKVSQREDPYKPEDPLIKRSPSGVQDANQLGAIFSMKRRNYMKNQTEVSLCDNRNLIINWDPDDPGNHNGSFRARIVDTDETSGLGRYRRKTVDVDAMAREVAAKIIRSFNLEEDVRVGSGRERRREDIEPRRPPPESRVVREVHNMYSQMFRHETDKLVQSKQALRKNLGVGERRKELTEQTLLQAQKSVQRGGKAKGARNRRPKGGDKPAPASDQTSSKRKKTPKEIAKEKVARNRQRRGLSEIARIPTEPANRFKPTTVDEQDARVAGFVEQVRRQRATETQGNTSVTTSPRKSKKFAVATDTDGDETIPSTPATKKKTTRRPARRVIDSSDDSSEDEVVKKRKETTKAKAGAAQERASEPGPELSKEEKEAQFQAEIAAIERAQLAAQKRKLTEVEEDASPRTTKKRKATPSSDDAEQSPQKKPRKSAAIIEDSDEEADYPIPDASIALPPADVRHEFTAAADELVEEVHQRQQEQVSTSPASPSPRGIKRKEPFSDVTEGHSTPPSSPCSRPIKKVKHNDFVKEVVSAPEQGHGTVVSPAAGGEDVKDSVAAEDVASDDARCEDGKMADKEEETIMVAEHAEKELDDWINDFFEEWLCLGV